MKPNIVVRRMKARRFVPNITVQLGVEQFHEFERWCEKKMVQRGPVVRELVRAVLAGEITVNAALRQPDTQEGKP